MAGAARFVRRAIQPDHPGHSIWATRLLARQRGLGPALDRALGLRRASRRGCIMSKWGIRISCLIVFLAAGCSGSGTAPELVWGQRGVQPGQIVKPRAIAIGPDDRMYLVDWTARIQAFDRNGKFLGAS